jgi:hypothetical protein
MIHTVLPMESLLRMGFWPKPQGMAARPCSKGKGSQRSTRPLVFHCGPEAGGAAAPASKRRAALFMQ